MNNVSYPPSAGAPGRLEAGAVAVSLALCLVSAAMVLVNHPLSELRRYLDVAEEANLPTWWSTVLLLTAALAHAVAGLAARQAQVRGATAWFVGAAVLAMLSLSEHTGLHNRLDGVGRQLVGDTTLTTDWLLLGTLVGLGVVATLTLVAVRLGDRAGRLLGIGGPVLLGAALGGEFAMRLLQERGKVERAYVLTYHAAELGENLGAVLLLTAATSVLTLTRESAVLRLRYRTGSAVTGPVNAGPVNVDTEPVIARRAGV